MTLRLLVFKNEVHLHIIEIPFSNGAIVARTCQHIAIIVMQNCALNLMLVTCVRSEKCPSRFYIELDNLAIF